MKFSYGKWNIKETYTFLFVIKYRMLKVYELILLFIKLKIKYNYFVDRDRKKFERTDLESVKK